MIFSDNRFSLVQRNYTFDAANMLTSAFEPGKVRVEYIYNGFGNRVSKREELSDSLDSVREVNYLLDMTLPYDNLLMEKGLQFEQKYTWGNRLVSGVLRPGLIGRMHSFISRTIWVRLFGLLGLGGCCMLRRGII